MNEREQIKHKFLVDCTDRQNAACTHGPKGRHERCISCVVEQAVADISALRQQQEGMVLVPVEPTPKMIQAAIDAHAFNIPNIYKAMIAAKP